MCDARWAGGGEVNKRICFALLLRDICIGEGGRDEWLMPVTTDMTHLYAYHLLLPYMALNE